MLKERNARHLLGGRELLEGIELTMQLHGSLLDDRIARGTLSETTLFLGIRLRLNNFVMP